MAKYKVVGTDHKSGKGNDGSTYDYTCLHLVSEKPIKGKDVAGVAVQVVKVYKDSGVCEKIPAVGAVINVEFNASGRIDEIYED